MDNDVDDVDDHVDVDHVQKDNEDKDDEDETTTMKMTSAGSSSEKSARDVCHIWPWLCDGTTHIIRKEADD